MYLEILSREMCVSLILLLTFFFLITLTLKFFKAIDLRVLDLEETPDICYPMCYLT